MAGKRGACQNANAMVTTVLLAILPVGCGGTATRLDEGAASLVAPDDGARDPSDQGAPPPAEEPEEQSVPADAYGARGTSVLMDPLTHVRFVALGDAGEGSPTQFAVADAIEQVCAVHGCDFALYLGDNFYDTGVNETNDIQFEEKFELPYANLAFPFWVVLGNHDYGGGGSGYEFWKGNYYIEYSDVSDKFTFPDLFYTVDYGLVDLFGLDTNAVMWGFFDDQQAWLDARLSESDAVWKIAFGHHPYLSNGPHGNAGEYEGYAPNPIWDGANVKQFFDDSVCGKVDLYVCGHDHSMQWPVTTCGNTELLVSGAGSKTTSFEGDDETWFEKDEEGFVYVDITETQFTATFYDISGNSRYSRTVTKN